ncbi:hypothetical protein [Cupriavidus basilensis]|uniref:hypothetical protein n=1 Tax=Cupriavidus basilensis TaxID=68895 RepID=UPI0011468D51|nr:hypothetical protein [Cupriavidus basilensis]
MTLDHCYQGDCRTVMRDLIAAGVRVHRHQPAVPGAGERGMKSVLNLMPAGEAVVLIVLVRPFRPAGRANERRLGDGGLPDGTEFLTSGFNKGIVPSFPSPIRDDRTASSALRHGRLPRKELILA